MTSKVIIGFRYINNVKIPEYENDNIADINFSDNMADINISDNMTDINSSDNMADINISDNMADINISDNMTDLPTSTIEANASVLTDDYDTPIQSNIDENIINNLST